MPAITRFRLLWLDEAVDRRRATPTWDGPDVRRFDDFAAASVTMPPMTFGATEGATDPDVVAAVRTATVSPIGRNPTYVVADAVVRFRFGFVTAGDVLFRDSLWHAPFHLIEGAQISDDACDLPDHRPATSLPAANRVMACNGENYYHWSMDVLAQYNPAAMAVPDGRGMHPATIALVPALDRPFKRETMDLLGVTARPHREVAGDEAVAAGLLAMKPATPMPHPRQMPNFDAIRTAALAGRGAPVEPRRIYVARLDSTNRRLENEAAVIELVRRHGFTVVSLTGLAIADQVRLFAAATHVVAPHGGGLANLLYCRAGTRVLELAMDGYTHWAFRHLCAVRRLIWGCVFGPIVPPNRPWIHDNSWVVPLDRLAAVLGDPAFAAGD